MRIASLTIGETGRDPLPSDINFVVALTLWPNGY